MRSARIIQLRLPLCPLIEVEPAVAVAVRSLRVMTLKRHWMCTAAMVLMPGLSPIKVLFGADTMLAPKLSLGADMRLT